MRTIVYVDAFNLYYGCVKDTPYKWLDIPGLCQDLLPPNRILAVKYFTARVQARPNDPDQPTRQATYIRALKTNPIFEVIYGHFLSNTRSMPLANGAGWAQVVYTEEKGSDVNLATHLLHDAFRGHCDVSVLVTNDSDLAEPVRIVTQDIGIRVGILHPVYRGRRYPSKQLTQYATFNKRIREGVLRSNQLPNPLHDSGGAIHKPSSW